MAIMRRNQAGSVNATSTNDAGNEERKKQEFVDVLGDTSLPTGEPQHIELGDPDDAWGRGKPPLGVFDLKLLPAGKETFVKMLVDNNMPESVDNPVAGYSASFECKVISDDKDFDGAVIYPKVTTFVRRGKKTSTMAALIEKAGFNPIPKGQTDATPLDVAKMFAKVLKTEKVLRQCEIDWSAGYFDDSAHRWVNVARTAEDFPLDSEDEKIPYLSELHVTKSDGSSDYINARAFVKVWGSAKASSTGTTHTSATKTAAKPVQQTSRPKVDPKPLPKLEEPVEATEAQEDIDRSQLVTEDDLAEL